MENIERGNVVEAEESGKTRLTLSNQGCGGSLELTLPGDGLGGSEGRDGMNPLAGSRGWRVRELIPGMFGDGVNKTCFWIPRELQREGRKAQRGLGFWSAHRCGEDWEELRGVGKARGPLCPFVWLYPGFLSCSTCETAQHRHADKEFLRSYCRQGTVQEPDPPPPPLSFYGQEASRDVLCRKYDLLYKSL